MVSDNPKEFLPTRRNSLWYSQKISELRSRLGLSQGEFGSRLGVSGAAIGQLERGESKSPSADLLAAMASMLSVNLDWLLNGEGEMLKSSEGTKKYSVPSGRSAATAETAAPYLPVARVLTIDDGENRAAPLYNFKTAASYLTGYDSQERPEPEGYLSMPNWLLKNGDYAIFPVIGDSMEPTFFAGDYVVCRAIHRGQWAELAPDTVACIVSESRGLQLKRLKLRPAEHLIRCKSDNRTVPAFNMPLEEVLEIWRFEWRLSANAANLSDTVFAKVDKLEDDVSDLRELLESVIDIHELRRLQARKNPNA